MALVPRAPAPPPPPPSSHEAAVVTSTHEFIEMMSMMILEAAYTLWHPEEKTTWSNQDLSLLHHTCLRHIKEGTPYQGGEAIPCRMNRRLCLNYSSSLRLGQMNRRSYHETMMYLTAGSSPPPPPLETFHVTSSRTGQEMTTRNPDVALATTWPSPIMSLFCPRGEAGHDGQSLSPLKGVYV